MSQSRAERSGGRVVTAVRRHLARPCQAFGDVQGVIPGVFK